MNIQEINGGLLITSEKQAVKIGNSIIELSDGKVFLCGSIIGEISEVSDNEYAEYIAMKTERENAL